MLLAFCLQNTAVKAELGAPVGRDTPPPDGMHWVSAYARRNPNQGQVPGLGVPANDAPTLVQTTISVVPAGAAAAPPVTMVKPEEPPPGPPAEAFPAATSVKFAEVSGCPAPDPSDP
jgi:hypothetical protein